MLKSVLACGEKDFFGLFFVPPLTRQVEAIILAVFYSSERQIL